jgi:hypothetical protein
MTIGAEGSNAGAIEAFVFFVLDKVSVAVCGW